jgi:hypothetical protein
VTHAHLKLKDDDFLEKIPLTYKFILKKGQWLKRLYVIIQVFFYMAAHVWVKTWQNIFKK